MASLTQRVVDQEVEKMEKSFGNFHGIVVKRYQDNLSQAAEEIAQLKEKGKEKDELIKELKAQLKKKSDDNTEAHKAEIAKLKEEYEAEIAQLKEANKELEKSGANKELQEIKELVDENLEGTWKAKSHAIRLMFKKLPIAAKTMGVTLRKAITNLFCGDALDKLLDICEDEAQYGPYQNEINWLEKNTKPDSWTRAYTGFFIPYIENPEDWDKIFEGRTFSYDDLHKILDDYEDQKSKCDIDTEADRIDNLHRKCEELRVLLYKDPTGKILKRFSGEYTQDYLKYFL